MSSVSGVENARGEASENKYRPSLTGKEFTETNTTENGTKITYTFRVIAGPNRGMWYDIKLIREVRVVTEDEGASPITYISEYDDGYRSFVYEETYKGQIGKTMQHGRVLRFSFGSFWMTFPL